VRPALAGVRAGGQAAGVRGGKGGRGRRATSGHLLSRSAGAEPAGSGVVGPKRFIGGRGWARPGQGDGQRPGVCSEGCVEQRRTHSHWLGAVWG